MLLPRPEALTLSEGQYPLNLQLQPQALSRTPEEESQCPSHLHADVTGISDSLCLKQLLIQPRPAPPTAFPIPTAEAETVASSLIPRLSHPHAVCVQNRTASQHLHDTTPERNRPHTTHTRAQSGPQCMSRAPGRPYPLRRGDGAVARGSPSMFISSITLPATSVLDVVIKRS